MDIKYINPLNNGDISDYNSLKKQRNIGSIINKYRKRLPTIPNETQKYYQYLTYQQPILDELNYVAERLKTEDIRKQKDNYDFIENLKIEKEKKLKNESVKNKEGFLFDLFDDVSTVKNEDKTPTINTELEMVFPDTRNASKVILKQEQNDLFSDIFSDIFSGADTLIEEKPKKKEKTLEELQLIEEKKAKSKARKEAKKQKTPEELLLIEEKKAKKEAKKEEKKKKEEAARIIQGALKNRKAFKEAVDIGFKKKKPIVEKMLKENKPLKEIKRTLNLFD
jgi:hypothetical protein